jgi:alkanesulfonate monooxygenase SsuD/methylene tetrahydromethanopterin reductase-like flavin-dependent oxidoreductase (luciferase family)
VKACLSIEIQEGLSYSQTLALTRSAEELGFDSSLLAEHYLPSGPLDGYSHPTDSADAWMYLAGLARDTRTIRLGTLVSPVTFRHPVVLAKMAATLDHMSGGRAELGIGAGWLEAEHEAFGFPFAAPGRRVDLVEEQLQVINGLFGDQQPFSHTGKAYTLQEAHFAPRPVQKPRLPIIVGGRTTSQRLARLAARYADEFVIGQPTPEQAAEMRQRLNAECARAGRDPSALKLSAFVPIAVAESEADTQKLLETYRKTNPQYVRMMGNLETWLLGTPGRAGEQLSALEASGVERVMLSVNCELHSEMLPLVAKAFSAAHR